MTNSILDKANDFTRFIEQLTNTMMNAVKLSGTNDVLTLRVEDIANNGITVFDFPTTLSDYLEIWNQVTENLKDEPQTFIIVANKENTQRFDELWVVWNYDTEEYEFTW